MKSFFFSVLNKNFFPYVNGILETVIAYTYVFISIIYQSDIKSNFYLSVISSRTTKNILIKNIQYFMLYYCFK